MPNTIEELEAENEQLKHAVDELGETIKKLARMGQKPRGLAALSPERRREIASKGGRAAHAKGTSYEWTPEEARRAGRKGGSALHRRRKP